MSTVMDDEKIEIEIDADGWKTDEDENIAQYVEVEYAEAGSSRKKQTRKRKRSTSVMSRAKVESEVETESWKTEEDGNVAQNVEVDLAEAGSSGTQASRRRRKSSSQSVGEVRRSSRNPVPSSVEKNDYIWTLEEKKNLLKAVKKYGHLDMNRLSEAVPQKSRSAIEAIIIKWWRRAAAIRQSEIENKPIFDRRLREYRTMQRKKYMNRKKQQKEPKLAPIEQWIRELRKAAPPSAYSETKALAKAMLYISLFEKHPDPEECGGVDFSALYDYLYRMLMGYPPKELNEPTVKYLLHVMDKLSETIKNDDYHSQMFHLKSVRKISLGPATVKQYGKSKKEEDQKPAIAEEEWMKSLLEVPGFNPLSTGLSLLKLE